jgi:hypothetical protein
MIDASEDWFVYRLEPAEFLFVAYKLEEAKEEEDHQLENYDSDD